MSDSTPASPVLHSVRATQDPSSIASGVGGLATDLSDDIALARRVATLIKSGGLSAAAAELPAATALVARNIGDVRTALPAIKAGWRTSEFWLAVGAAAAIVATSVLGHPLPFDVDAVLAAIAAIYTAARSFVKASQPPVIRSLGEGGSALSPKP